MSSQMARGSVWVFVSYSIQQLITLGRTMILARLLAPADFGLMGYANLATAALLILTETGVWPAVIQRKDLDAETEHTAWFIMAARSMIVTLAIIALAPVAGSFFEEPRLVPVVRVMALTFLMGGFNSLSVVLLQRDMRFEKLTYLNLVVVFVNLFASVIAAFFLRSVWALVIGELAGSATALLSSYLLHSYRPKPGFSWARARELLGFGRYVTGSGILSYLTTQGVDAVIGKLLGTEALGYYGVGFRAANLPATSISQVLNRVTLPAFSRVQDDLPRLANTYLRTLRLTALFAFPIAGGMFALAPFLIPVLYGPQWTAVIMPFMALCLFGLERSLGSIAVPTFLALGKSRWVMGLNLVKLIALAVFIIPLVRRYGILGAAIAASISAIAVQLVVIPATARLLNIRISVIIGALLKPAAGTAAMVVSLLLVQQIPVVEVSLLWLLAFVALGMLVYGILVLWGEKENLLHVGHSLIAE